MSTPRTPRTAEELDQQVQDDLMRLDAYRSQLNSMLQQHQYLSSSRVDHLRARAALDGLDRSPPDTELLIPLGGETFARGKAVPETPVLLGIGSGYVVEMERPKAAEVVSQRLLKIEEATQELEGQMRSLEERIQILSARIESLTRGGGAPNAPGPTDDVGGD